MILDRITADRKKTVDLLKLKTSISDLMRQIETHEKEGLYQKRNFREALSSKEVLHEGFIHIIAEVKKASPSKGLICKEFDYIEIAKSYERGGAAALSVLTEPLYFQGRNSYLSAIKKTVGLPILRKDFLIDEWQIYEAKAIGADAILLIVACLDDQKLKYFLSLAHGLGLDCLVETHDEEEVKRALEAGCNIIGVNNRNLKNFEVSLEVSQRLRALVPREKIFVSESGIHSEEDIRKLKAIGSHAVLIGESVVKAKDRETKLKSLIEA